jgi:hypothetical protein
MLSSLNINDMLKKYNYTEVSNQQLAEHLNFTEEEQKMIQMFWKPAFNGSWIYLNDEIILGQLTKETGKDALTHFYKRVLLSEDYKENVDYKEINKDDELIKEYEKMSSLFMARRTKVGKGLKKYYAITGETYKDLLQRSANKKGKTTRQYYRKIEQLAIMMKDYLVGLNLYNIQKQLQLKDSEIEATKLELKSKDESYNRLNTVNIELLTFKKNNQKNESVYIVATYKYATQGIFKVGRTKCMKARTSGHNNTHITGDKVKVLKEFKVNDSIAVENYIHRKLKGLLVNNEKEFFLCPYDLLENIIDVIVNKDENNNNLIDSIVDTVYQLKGFRNSTCWTRGIDINIFNEEYKLICTGDEDEDKAVFNVTTASPEQKKAFVSECVKAYKETIEEPNKLIWKNFQEYFIPLLNLPKYKYKALEWKPLFNEASTI